MRVTDHGLIVDVGMHTGEDTAFYLAKGFRVLAIEASPELAEQAARRFAADVRMGRLEILNVAAADAPGHLEFYVSDREGWGTTRRDWVESRSGLGVGYRSVTVRADTLASILSGRDRPHFVKVDIEGADAACVRGMASLPEMPAYVSVECDTAEQTDSLEILDALVSYGYQRFKLVNQVHNPSLRCPYPPLEGEFVDARFTHYHSGLFGEESPGAWQSPSAVMEQYVAISRQQALRSRYTATGKVVGIPIGRWHRQIEWVYNAPPVRGIRATYARVRGSEVGGWFDLHASL